MKKPCLNYFFQKFIFGRLQSPPSVDSFKTYAVIEKEGTEFATVRRLILIICHIKGGVKMSNNHCYYDGLPKGVTFGWRSQNIEAKL